MTARRPPTSTTSSSWATISSRVPAAGDGISVSTLSVDTSTRASSASTESPTSFSQRVTVPSVTDSPSSGMVTSVPSLDPDPDAAGLAGSGSDSGSGSGSGSASCSAGASSEPASPESASSELPPDSPSSPIWASSPPTSTTSSSWATIFVRTPEAGAGISVSTLSVDTSSNGSSASTVSPSCLSHLVTVPSVTLSPRAGIWTEKAIVVDSSISRSGVRSAV